ncbi:MAG: FxLYD domain-containing protein [Anaerolineales bacterium]
MRKLSIYLLLTMLLVLAACTGDENGDDGPQEAPIEPESDATERALADISVGPNPGATPIEGAEDTEQRRPGAEMQPGVRDSSQVDILQARDYLNEDESIGWVVVLLENTTDTPLQNVAVNVNLLDDTNRTWEAIRVESPFRGIPPGVQIPFVVGFEPPPNYADFLVVPQAVSYEQTAPTGELEGFFNLPTSVDDLPGDDLPFTVSGSLTNDTGRDLIALSAELHFYNDAGDLVGVASGVLDGLNDQGQLLAGETATFSANVFSLAEPDVATVRVTAAGYAPAE